MGIPLAWYITLTPTWALPSSAIFATVFLSLAVFYIFFAVVFLSRAIPYILFATIFLNHSNRDVMFLYSGLYLPGFYKSNAYAFLDPYKSPLLSIVQRERSLVNFDLKFSCYISITFLRFLIISVIKNPVVSSLPFSILLSIAQKKKKNNLEFSHHLKLFHVACTRGFLT